MKTQDFQNKKIAIYGGSFNPIHVGHLLTGFDVLEFLHYDLILYIPLSVPVHKQVVNPVDPRKRFEMVRLAVKDIDCFDCSDIEIERGGNSYTIDTVRELEKRYGIKNPGVIFGDDLLVGLSTWKQIDELTEISQLICLTRLETKPSTVSYPIRFLNNRRIDISSSEIRERVRTGRAVNFMVTDDVKNYIVDEQLYRN